MERNEIDDFVKSFVGCISYDNPALKGYLSSIAQRVFSDIVSLSEISGVVIDVEFFSTPKK